MDCLFCKIINKEIPSYTIYEDDMVKVFLDINPDTNGHTLIIPKKHYTDLMDIPDEELLHIQKIAQKISILLEDKLQIKGFSLIQNNGSAQLVKHYHLHIKPCYGKVEPIKPIADIYDIITSQ